ncbi:MAG: TetR/AcrR family transcriptional regulator [Ferruginibacter sp.]
MPRLRVARHPDKKSLILEKAARLFRRKGFAATTMRELAESLNIEAASLYNHIGSKDELLQSICFDVANAFIQHIEQAEAQRKSAIERLTDIVRFHVHMMTDRYDAVFVANHEWKQLKDPFLSNFLHQRKLYENRLIALVQSGIRKKELRNLNAKVVVFTLLSAVRGLEFWQRNKNGVSKKELETVLIDHLFNGIIK